jgi:hypothetical protein
MTCLSWKEVSRTDSEVTAISCRDGSLRRAFSAAFEAVAAAASAPPPPLPSGAPPPSGPAPPSSSGAAVRMSFSVATTGTLLSSGERRENILARRVPSSAHAVRGEAVTSLTGCERISLHNTPSIVPTSFAKGSRPVESTYLRCDVAVCVI